MVNLNLSICSKCKCHRLPFIAECSIAYTPNQKMMSLNKLSKITEFIPSNLLNQVVLAEKIAKIIEKAIQPKGVLVIVRAMHPFTKFQAVMEEESEKCSVFATGEFLKNQGLADSYLEKMQPFPRL